MADRDADDGDKYAQRPDSLRQLRACKTCKLVKTIDQFTENFCENCWADWENGAKPTTLARGRKHDAAIEHTTADYQGLVAMMRPENSWVARWLKMHKTDEEGARAAFKPGLYALSLPGEEATAAASGAAGEEDEYEDEEGDDAELEGEDDGDDEAGDGAGAGRATGSAAGGSAGAAAAAPAAGKPAAKADEMDLEAREAAADAAMVEPDDEED